MHEEGSGASSSALNMEGRESRNKNRNKNQRGRSKSKGRSKSRNRQGNNSIISNEARKTSSAGIVARWVTTLVSVNLERRTMARAVQIVFQRRQTIALFAHLKARWNLGC
jgi:hypothetical protein